MRAKNITWTKDFSQDADTCSREETQYLTVEQDDGGGGPFWRIKTEEWSVDSIEEFIELLEEAGVGRRGAQQEAAE